MIAIPARDEAERLARCLEALAAQRDVPAGHFQVILILNNCRDHGLAVALGAAARLRLPLAVHAVELRRRWPMSAGRGAWRLARS